MADQQQQQPTSWQTLLNIGSPLAGVAGSIAAGQAAKTVEGQRAFKAQQEKYARPRTAAYNRMAGKINKAEEDGDIDPKTANKARATLDQISKATNKTPEQRARFNRLIGELESSLTAENLDEINLQSQRLTRAQETESELLKQRKLQEKNKQKPAPINKSALEAAQKKAAEAARKESRVSSARAVARTQYGDTAATLKEKSRQLRNLQSERAKIPARHTRRIASIESQIQALEQEIKPIQERAAVIRSREGKLSSALPEITKSRQSSEKEVAGRQASQSRYQQGEKEAKSYKEAEVRQNRDFMSRLVQDLASRQEQQQKSRANITQEAMSIPGAKPQEKPAAGAVAKVKEQKKRVETAQDILDETLKRRARMESKNPQEVERLTNIATKTKADIGRGVMGSRFLPQGVRQRVEGYMAESKAGKAIKAMSPSRPSFPTRKVATGVLMGGAAVAGAPKFIEGIRKPFQGMATRPSTAATPAAGGGAPRASARPSAAAQSTSEPETMFKNFKQTSGNLKLNNALDRFSKGQQSAADMNYVRTELNKIPVTNDDNSRFARGVLDVMNKRKL